MSKDYPSLRKNLLQQIGALRSSEPDLMAAFAELGKHAYREGALSKKIKELLALGIAITARCDGDCEGTIVAVGHSHSRGRWCCGWAHDGSLSSGGL